MRSSPMQAAPPVETFDSPQNASPRSYLRLFAPWMLICILWAGLLAFDERFMVDPDGVSYIDMASQTVQHGPAELINGYWSPGYPALLSLAFAVVHPSPQNKAPIAHFVNWLIFIASTFAFASLLQAWLDLDPVRGARRTLLVPIAFGLFLWGITEFIGIGILKPDLLVAFFVLLASAICARIAQRPRSAGPWIALGVVLAAGYYAKAVMLPLGLALLAIVLVFPLSRKTRRVFALLAGLVLLALAAPLTKLITDRVGHFSTGETGRLNYLWYAEGVLPIHIGWTGDPVHGTPAHGPRLLEANPRVIAWNGSPVHATYPLWFDPAYFHAGVTSHFDLRQQLAATEDAFLDYFSTLQMMSALSAAALAILFAVRLRGERITGRPAFQAWMLLWPAAAFGLYSLVHAETRFYGGFIILFWLGAFGWLSGRLDPRTEALALGISIGTLLMPMALSLPAKAAHFATGLMGRGGQPEPVLVARGLRNLGLKPGDPLAGIGRAAAITYGAQIDGLEFIAEAPENRQFWALPGTEREMVEKLFRNVGAKAVIANDGFPALLQEGWQPITGTNVKVLLLDTNGRADGRRP